MAGFSTQPSVGTPATAGNQDNLISNEIITDSGQINITPSAANVPTSAAVTFSKTFPVAPKVMVTPSSGVAGSQIIGWAATSQTTTGCLVWVTRINTTVATLHWFAVVTQ